MNQTYLLDGVRKITSGIHGPANVIFLAASLLFFGIWASMFFCKEVYNDEVPGTKTISTVENIIRIGSLVIFVITLILAIFI